MATTGWHPKNDLPRKRFEENIGRRPKMSDILVFLMSDVVLIINGLSMQGYASSMKWYEELVGNFHYWYLNIITLCRQISL